MKPPPPHHKTVAIPRADVAKGYGGARLIPNAGPGWWLIVAASPTDDAPPARGPKPALISVIVAPYTRGAGT
jgi:hypothetical protein